MVDYGMGNLRSVRKALDFLGFPSRLVRGPEELDGVAGVVVPGVGAFPDAMARLERNGMARAVADAAARGVPLLGICLGMQLLFAWSDEGAGAAGLGLLPGRVVRLEGGDGLKVPHMGWNTAEWEAGFPLCSGLTPPAYFYFVHSYCVPAETALPPGSWWAVCRHGRPFLAAVQRGNVMGTQFHPEKSGRAGLALLANFGAMCQGRLPLAAPAPHEARPPAAGAGEGVAGACC